MGIPNVSEFWNAHSISLWLSPLNRQLRPRRNSLGASKAELGQQRAEDEDQRRDRDDGHDPELRVAGKRLLRGRICFL